MPLAPSYALESKSTAAQTPMVNTVLHPERYGLDMGALFSQTPAKQARTGE